MTSIKYYRNFTYADVHVDAARLIARISRECNVQKLIHFSSLNASLNPQVIYFKPSQFLITKVRLLLNKLVLINQ